MPKRSRMPRDTNQLAASVVANATGTEEPTPDEDDWKDPAAVALGRKGGLRAGRQSGEADRRGTVRDGAEGGGSAMGGAPLTTVRMQITSVT